MYSAVREAYTKSANSSNNNDDNNNTGHENNVKSNNNNNTKVFKIYHLQIVQLNIIKLV